MAKMPFIASLLFLSMNPWITGLSKTLRPQECWWEIIILLTSKGQYTFKERQTSYSGEYTYTIQWSGCMEQDGEDFILYHENSELLRWEPREKQKQSGVSETTVTREFSEKPRLAFNYILIKGNNLHFDFLVHGFRVPQLNPKHQYYLHLPASKENSFHPTDIDYGLHVYEGSNQVYFSREDILTESAKKKFFWSWKRYSSSRGLKTPAYLSHSYDVDVEISILKHLKK
jgi:hypothetical protein